MLMSMVSYTACNMMLQGGKAKLSAHMGELVESDFTHKSENTQTKKQSRPKVSNSSACQILCF